MSVFIVKGGKKLRGKIRISGAKNSALKVLLGALLTSEPVILRNIPTKILDVQETIRMLRSLGVSVNSQGDQVVIDPTGFNRREISTHDDYKIRTILLMLGVMLSRFGQAKVPLPGGCKIGDRKFDLHLKALRQMGAKIEVKDGVINANCRQLQGARIDFPLRTTGGTENVLFAAVLAKGKTVIKNAHTRPEVIDLIRFLNSMGAKIKVFGAGLIEVIGVDKLRGVEYRIINDNVEALTYIIAAAITGGMIQIQNCPLRDMEIPLIYLRASGLKFAIENGSLIVKGGNRYTPIDLSTGSYPGVNSDYQPLFTVFASQAEGISHITDIRFRDRFQYLYQLRKMGLKVRKQSETITITGPVKLQGTSVKAVDLRAGAALIVAALCAAGKTKIYNVDQIDRGYENIEIKLANLGGSIKRKGGN